MADNLNHSDVNVLCEIVTNSLHKEPNEKSNYFTKAKFMNDFSLAFSDKEIKEFPDIKGRFSKENYQYNKRKYNSYAEVERHSRTR